MTQERLSYLAILTVLITMLIGSNYQLAQMRKQNELNITTAVMLSERQTELKDMLRASELKRKELLGLWVGNLGGDKELD